MIWVLLILVNIIEIVINIAFGRFDLLVINLFTI